MATWAEIEAEAPELVALARTFFDAFTHKTMATVRRDGSPRISGTECEFRDGNVYIGSMWMAQKALDLRRDPRFALHSGSPNPSEWKGDAKVAGRAVEETQVTDPPPAERSHLFRLDLTELVVVRIGEPADHLIIESWHEGRGYTRVRRD